jgi:hypothetical protein
MSRTTSAATSGGIAAELRNWARGCYSTEAAVELLIRARGGRFVDPGQPWLRTDDRGIPSKNGVFWRSLVCIMNPHWLVAHLVVGCWKSRGFDRQWTELWDVGLVTQPAPARLPPLLGLRLHS